MVKTAVYALGGNALASPTSNSSENELEVLARAISDVVDLLEAGWHVIMTHGNGPQVGQLLALEQEGLYELDQWVAATQSMIGYKLTQAMSSIFLQRNRPERVVVVPTRVLVDAHDPGFTTPTKPVGPILSSSTVMTADWHIAETIHGPRRVVASPKPIEIIDIDVIQHISNLHAVTICCGGGGIPTIRDGTNFIGVPAVIDKDLCSSLLAISVDAGAFIITTAVPGIATDYGKETQKYHSSITLTELKSMYDQGVFPAGSMGPKAKSLIMAKSSKPSMSVVLCEPGNALRALKGTKGTTIA
ncbi:MAG: carbamate kinase [archaeon]|nr:carbamate kinase [archaeon]MDA1168177.1 carbamate kinase [archaeon]